MVTLSDIVLASKFDRITEDMPSWHQKLIRYRVYDCQTLYDYVSTDKPNFSDKEYKSILTQATNTINRLNKAGVKRTFTFEYPDNPDLLRAIELTDQKVYGDELPIYHPLYDRQLKNKLYSSKIDEIKYLLGKMTTVGQNAIIFLGRQQSYRNEFLVNRGIELYNAQLIRTAKNVQNLSGYEGNLFLENREEKEKIVMEHIRDIIYYLISNGIIFAWGKMGESTKTILDNSVTSIDPDERVYSIRLASIVRDYTTLEELEGNFIEDGTLKRFILEPQNTKK